MLGLGFIVSWQAILLVIFAYFGYKIAAWMQGFFKRMAVINQIKGMPMLPFIGNAHQLHMRESSF
jgi:hypothetical protein